MNYQHAFHAAGFSDVVKHTILVMLINALQKKERPFCFIDTHAGQGLYNLMETEAQKTEEYLCGVTKLMRGGHADYPAVIQQYLRLITHYNLPVNSNQLHLYPGSPLVALSMLREQDRAILNELHPECVHTLRKTLRTCKQVHIHQRDAYEFLPAILPPPQQRGLILIDPPFEKTTEFSDIILALEKSLERFATGVYMIWFPIKSHSPQEFYHNLCKLDATDILLVELAITDPMRAGLSGLKACGVAILNPPWQVFEALQQDVFWLGQKLALDPKAFSTVKWLKKE